MNFGELGLIEPILRSLEEEGYKNPTPIQANAIPIILRGHDLLGCAQTGTGKTAAFAIPILQKLATHDSDASVIARNEVYLVGRQAIQDTSSMREGSKDTKPLLTSPSHGRSNDRGSLSFRRGLGGGHRPIRSLIVTPTRELAIQIGENFRAYGRHIQLRSTVIFGGVGQHSQVNALRDGVDILIATPGRLLDLIKQEHISLANVEIFVLDEADRMLDMGFIHDVKKLVALLPKKKQSLFFSATMPPEIVKLAHTILQNPEKVTVTPVSSTVEIIHQQVFFVDRGNKNKLLLEVLGDKSIKTALVFTRTKHGANKVVKMLLENRITADAIHGNKAQNARQRALQGFKDQSIRVLVATDIAARGIDVDELEYVINYEIPNIPETYVHRIGRTGRAGARGTAMSFCDAEEKAYLRDIEKLIGKKIPIIEGHPFPLVDHNPPKTPPPGQRGGFHGSKPKAHQPHQKNSPRGTSHKEKHFHGNNPSKNHSQNQRPPEKKWYPEKKKA